MYKRQSQYISHYSKTEWRPHAGWLTGATTSGFWLRGTRITLSNSVLGYSAGNGVHTIGSYITVSNNVIHDVNHRASN